MCGRFTQERPASELAEIFAAEPLADELGARYNVAPTDEAFVVVQREERRAVTAYRWGLVPHWSTDGKGASRMFNARAETITASPAFREAFRRRRCIVPVDSFYEWKREGTIRQPYRVIREDGRPLALAGLWAGWRDPESDEVRRTFTIVTTTPNDAMADLHDRMPVVLDESMWGQWLVDGRAGWVQIGVTSFGTRTCGENPSVFARLSEPGIAKFIAKTIGMKAGADGRR